MSIVALRVREGQGFAAEATCAAILFTTGKLGWFYDYGWFTGSIVGGLVYYAASRSTGARVSGPAPAGEVT